jgi:integrase
LALRWEDFDDGGATLSIARSAEQRGRNDAPPKTRHSARRIRLEETSTELLKRQPRTGERIFPFTYAAAHAAMRRALARAGTARRDRGWHSLRHMNTALRDRAGQSIRQAAAELGHGPNFVMTASYGWASEAGEPAPVSKVRHRPAPGSP